MKRLLVLLLIFPFFATWAQRFQTEIPESYGFDVTLGQVAPDFTIALPTGETTTLSALRGKVVMLQFTASWCSVCRKEMPHIENDIWQRHQNNEHFALYGIDLLEDAKTIQKFQKKTGVTYPIALDADGHIFDLYTQENAGVTRNIIIDQSGKIVFMTRLYDPVEFDRMKEVIELLLAE